MSQAVFAEMIGLLHKTNHFAFSKKAEILDPKKAQRQCERESEY